MKEWPNNDDRTTTSIDVASFEDVRRQALLAHETQVDPNSGFWFALPPEVARTVHPYEDYILATSLVDTELPEDDLFAGVRDLVRR
jgi:mycothiol S-conjugate amidase